jgi:hypothetical protein
LSIAQNFLRPSTIVTSLEVIMAQHLPSQHDTEGGMHEPKSLHFARRRFHSFFNHLYQ